MKFSPSLTLSKIEHFSKVSFFYPDPLSCQACERDAFKLVFPLL
ncbi:conserved hypothetical protein [delta proteobacterium NaphS2]|nr:conserved hypothetical protein [delta proteobacterium NaphS2]